MEESVINSKKASKRSAESLLERIAITKENSTKLKNWIDQVKASRPGVTVSKKDFLNWFLSQQDDKLQTAIERAAAHDFYDEIKFLRSTLQDFERAKAAGEKLDLRRLIEALPSPLKSADKTAARRGLKAKTPSEKLGDGAKNESDPDAISSLINQPKAPYVE